MTTTKPPPVIANHGVYVLTQGAWRLGVVERAFDDTVTVSFIDPATNATVTQPFLAVNVYPAQCFHVVRGADVKPLDELGSGTVIVATEPSTKPGHVALTLDNDGILTWPADRGVLIRK